MAAGAWGALAAGLAGGVAAGLQRQWYSDALKRASGGTDTSKPTTSSSSTGAQTMTGHAPVVQPGQTLPGGLVAGQPAGMITPATYGTQQFGPPAPAVHPAVAAAAAAPAFHPAVTPTAVVPGTAQGLRAGMPNLAPPTPVWGGGSAGPYGVQQGGWGQANVPLNVGARYPQLNIGPPNSLPLPTAGPGRYPALPSYMDDPNQRPLYPGY